MRLLRRVWAGRPDRVYRDAWLVVITGLVVWALAAFEAQQDTTDRIARDGRATARQLAKLRTEGVPIANERNRANCEAFDAVTDAIAVIAKGQRAGQTPRAIALFRPLLQGDPELIDELIAAGKARTEQLDISIARLKTAQNQLVCEPIAVGLDPNPD